MFKLILPFSLCVCANFSMMKAGDLPESHRLGSVNMYSREDCVGSGEVMRTSLVSLV